MRLTRAQRKSILLKARLQELLLDSNRKALTTRNLSFHKTKGNGSIFLSSDEKVAIDLGPMRPEYFKPCNRETHPTTSTYSKEFLIPANQIVQAAWPDEIAKELDNHRMKGLKPFLSHQTVSCHELGIFSFARIIGLDPGRVRYLIDYEFQSNRPGFNSLIVPAKAVDEFVSRYGGVYSLYRRDIFPKLEEEYFEGSSIVTKGAASIRYPIPHKRQRRHHAHRSDRERVRTKLVMPLYPKISGLEKLLVGKYDGFVAPTQDNSEYLLWAMEVRGFSEGQRDVNISGDFATLYTTKMQPVEQDPEIEYIYGAMLTQSQERSRFPILRQFVMMRHTEYSIRQYGEMGLKSDIYKGGHYALVDNASGRPFNEREILREQVGFIIDGKEFYTRNRKRIPLNRRDQYALEVLDSPEVRKFLVPEMLDS